MIAIFPKKNPDRIYNIDFVGTPVTL